MITGFLQMQVPQENTYITKIIVVFYKKFLMFNNYFGTNGKQFLFN